MVIETLIFYEIYIDWSFNEYFLCFTHSFTFHIFTFTIHGMKTRQVIFITWQYTIQCSYKNTEIHTTYIVSKIVQKVIFEEEK